jgi:hypothetical protein
MEAQIDHQACQFSFHGPPILCIDQVGADGKSYTSPFAAYIPAPHTFRGHAFCSGPGPLSEGVTLW